MGHFDNGRGANKSGSLGVWLRISNLKVWWYNVAEQGKSTRTGVSHGLGSRQGGQPNNEETTAGNPPRGGGLRFVFEWAGVRCGPVGRHSQGILCPCWVWRSGVRGQRGHSMPCSRWKSEGQGCGALRAPHFRAMVVEQSRLEMSEGGKHVFTVRVWEVKRKVEGWSPPNQSLQPTA